MASFLDYNNSPPPDPQPSRLLRDYFDFDPFFGAFLFMPRLFS